MAEGDHFPPEFLKELRAQLDLVTARPYCYECLSVRVKRIIEQLPHTTDEHNPDDNG